MFRQIIENLPPDPRGVLITLIVAIGIGVGALTALLGALHSRVTISLMMFSVGAMLGVVLPGWLAMSIDRAVPIAFCAITFGLLGFLLHRICVATTLAFLAAAVALFILYDQTQAIDTQPAGAVQLQGSLLATGKVLWAGAPDKFRSLAPWVASGAFAVFGALGFAMPKFGMAALYSLGGTMLALFCIRLGHESDKITWLDSIKTGPMTIAVLGLTMLLVGFVTQLALLNRPGAEKKEKRQPQEVAV